MVVQAAPWSRRIRLGRTLPPTQVRHTSRLGAAGVAVIIAEGIAWLSPRSIQEEASLSGLAVRIEGWRGTTANSSHLQLPSWSEEPTRRALQAVYGLPVGTRVLRTPILGSRYPFCCLRNWLFLRQCAARRVSPSYVIPTHKEHCDG
jgi:hypothetical protein